MVTWPKGQITNEVAAGRHLRDEGSSTLGDIMVKWMIVVNFLLRYFGIFNFRKEPILMTHPDSTGRPIRWQEDITFEGHFEGQHVTYRSFVSYVFGAESS